MPLIIVLLLVGSLLLGPLIPHTAQQFMYALSLTVGSLIGFCLPPIVFGMLFKSLVRLSGSATVFVVALLSIIASSIVLATFLGHCVGTWVYSFDLASVAPKLDVGISAKNSVLEPLFNIRIPKFIANDRAMIAGVVLGLISPKLFPIHAKNVANFFELCIGRLLKGMIYLIPLFLIGSIIKVRHDGTADQLFGDYAKVIGIVVTAMFLYISAIYFLVNRCSIRSTIFSIRNMIPAIVGGFVTMSSAVTMPLIISGVEKNSKNKELAQSTVSMSVNNHLIGDSLAIPILAYAILKSFAMPEPTLPTYAAFVFYFVIAKFSTVSVPGGGVLVLLPVLQSSLGFNADMLSLITAIYILMDPFIACANVFGNGVFALVIDRWIGPRLSLSGNEVQAAKEDDQVSASAAR